MEQDRKAVDKAAADKGPAAAEDKAKAAAGDEWAVRLQQDRAAGVFVRPAVMPNRMLSDSLAAEKRAPNVERNWYASN